METEFELWVSTATTPIIFSDLPSLAYYMKNTVPAGTPMTVNVKAKQHKFTWIFNGPNGQPLPAVGTNTAPIGQQVTHMRQP